jgi:hypothetical protein
MARGTMWPSRDAPALSSISLSDLGTYRRAVAGVVDEVDRLLSEAEHRLAERRIETRLAEPELHGVLSRLPRGVEAVAEALTHEMHRFRNHPRCRPSSHSLSSVVGVYLLSQIDAVWWSGTPTFATDADAMASPDLVDLDDLRRQGRVHFQYRRLPQGLPGHARAWVRRRVLPALQPHTAGMRITRARPEAVAMLNQLSLDLRRRLARWTPRVWVTSVVRSVADQHHLRSLGYPAFLPSAHCSGYAVDVEVAWFRRFGADGVLTSLLLERQHAGQVNLIDEGQGWHVCLSPSAQRELAQACVSTAGA